MKAKSLAHHPGAIRELYKLDGYWWHDNTGGEYAQSTLSLANDNLGVALKYVRKRNVVVQAGGYTGVWPAYLAFEFKRVYTFEPEINNFRALVANCPYGNVFPFRAFLGASGNLSGIDDNCRSGSCRVKGAGAIPMLYIDQFNLDACDLIQLDVERYEAPILMGAINTIRNYKPIIMVEALSKRTTDAYHWGYDHVVDFLQSCKYEIKDKVNKDIVWGPK